MADISLSHLSPEQKRAMVAELVRADKRKLAPLSPAQQRMLFLQQYAPASSLYNIPHIFRLKGKLDVVSLERAISAVIGRHEALRTSFIRLGDRFMQAISPPGDVPLPVISLEHLPEDQRDHELHNIFKQQGSQNFDLSAGPPVRNVLVRMSEEDHVLLRTIHHIVCDGWSMGIFNNELAILYDAFCKGAGPPLPASSIQYSDYVLWQREWLKSENLEEQRRYWKNQLAGAPSLLELPTDRPRPAAQSFRGATELLSLPPQLTEKLKEVCQRCGVTLYMMLLTAFQLLLHRYSGQEEVVAGSPVAGRSRKEIEGMIGCVVNSVALRSNFAGNPRVQEMLGRVRQTTVGAFSHQDVPFAMLVEEVQPEREMGHSPIFQVFFIYENIPGARMQLNGLRVTYVQAHNGTSKFDLSLAIVPAPDRTVGLLEYSTEMFDSGTMVSLLRHFKRMLTAMLADPETPVDDLPLLEEAEQRQIVFEWNRTQAPHFCGCVHELFQEQARRTPQLAAVIWEGEEITYAELNRKANYLAHYLRHLGATNETLVGICMERSIAMMVGLLGILKAGAAYLPLDPAYPSERLRLMFEDSHMSLLLTQEHLLPHFPENQCTSVCVDRDWPRIAQQSPENPDVEISQQSLAYVIYTSGSTGIPKGVMISHGSIVNFFAGMDRVIECDPGDTLLAVTSISFDISVLELFWTLTRGARVAVVSDFSKARLRSSVATEEKESGLLYFSSADRQPAANNDRASDRRKSVHTFKTLPDLATELTATLMQCTPSMMQMLAESSEFLALRGLRTVLVGGEALPPSVAFQVRGVLQSRLFNMYGPTETTIWSSTDEVETESLITIGRPIANTQLYVLERGNDMPVPIGVPGELYIGGAGVARGYLGRPELTAERFRPDPFSENAGARMYRTGDLVRYLPHGKIQHLGRTDNQIKLRGHRIELGEIEALLERHPVVSRAAVILREDAPGDKRLVAYVEEGKGDLKIADLRLFLKDRLPEYMVPSAFVYVEKLPLTPNGKLDRRSLPAPGLLETGEEQQYVGPRNEIEAKLAQIWEKALKTERVSIEDNFFELGGHSLLVMQVIGRIRDSCGIDLPLRVFFENATISGLADYIQMSGISSPLPGKVPGIPAVSRNQPLSLSPRESMVWLASRFFPALLTSNTVAGTRILGPLNVSALDHALQEISRRHEVLRTAFRAPSRPNDPPLRVIALNARLPISVTDLRIFPPEARENKAIALFNEEIRRPFNFSRGPLVRVHLIKLQEEEHILLAAFHHIIVDGWSFSVFANELRSLYETCSEQKPPTLPPLPIQYADYAHWKWAQIAEPGFKAGIEFWKKYLERLPAHLPLPTDALRPLDRVMPSNRLSFSISTDQANALKNVGAQEGLTLFMTLLAIFQLLLARLSGMDDIAIGVAVAGRGHSELEGLIGLFADDIVVRTDLSGDPKFREFLRRVRTSTEAAYANHDVPLLVTMEALPPQEISRLRRALYHASFNYLSVPDGRLRLHGLETQNFLPQISESSIQEDVNLVAHETGDGIRLTLKYKKQLFSVTRMTEFVSQFKALISQASSESEKKISSFSLSTTGGSGVLPNPAEPLYLDWKHAVHSRFAANARLHPDRMALLDSSGPWTYQELQARSNQVASFLIRNGIKPGHVVGVCSRSVSATFICGVLGVLKAGAAFMAVDVNSDIAALRASGVQAWVQIDSNDGTPTGLASQLAASDVCCRLPFHWPRSPGNPLANCPEDDIETQVRPTDPAWVSMASTNGKSVELVFNAHARLSRFPQALAPMFDLGLNDRFNASGRFHPSLPQEILLPLWLGAGLYIPETDWDPEQLLQWRSTHQITVLSLCDPKILRTANLRLPESLRWAFFYVEILASSDVKRLLDVAPQARCLNFYTPAAAIGPAAFFEVSGGAPTVSIVPIGRGIPGAQLLILTTASELAGIGELGEIYVRMTGLEKLRTQAMPLDAERCRHNPHTREPGDWIYKTGDLGRYRPDGIVEYVGKTARRSQLDCDVIQLEDIETALAQHPQVKQVTVQIEPEHESQNQLVAYVVLISSNKSHVDLKKFLQEKLPPFMLPAVFVHLHAIPLLPDGSVNREMLKRLNGTAKEFSLEREKMESRISAGI